MSNYKIIHDFKDDASLRSEYHQLLQKVFNFDLEKYFQSGYWNHQHDPHALIVDGKMVSNVAINKHDLILDGKSYKALQIGSVMTHPDYRHKGLAAKLMNYVMESYKGEYEIFYLYANDSVLDFYPKFGFKRVKEHIFSTAIDGFAKSDKKLEKLNIENIRTREFIYNLACKRSQLSNRFYVLNSEFLLMFHCLYTRTENIYYDNEERALIIYSVKENDLHIWDVVSERQVDFRSILSKIPLDGLKKVVFHFSPDFINISTSNTVFYDEDNVFFINGIEPEFSSPLHRMFSAEA